MSLLVNKAMQDRGCILTFSLRHDLNAGMEKAFNDIASRFTVMFDPDPR